MRTPTTILLITALMGCSTTKEAQPPFRAGNWIPGLGQLAAEAVQSEMEFWPDPEKGRALAEHVSPAPPRANSSGTYVWSLGGYTVVVDMLDEMGYLPGRERGRRGRLGVRVLSLIYQSDDRCLNSLRMFCGRKEYTRMCRPGEPSQQRIISGKTTLVIRDRHRFPWCLSRFTDHRRPHPQHRQ